MDNRKAFASRAQPRGFTGDDLPSSWSDTYDAGLALQRREEIAVSDGVNWGRKVDERAQVIGKLGGNQQRARDYDFIPKGLAGLWREVERDGRLEEDPTWRAATPEQRVAYEHVRDMERRFPGQVLDDEALLAPLKDELAALRADDQYALKRGPGSAAFLGSATGVMSDPTVLITAPLGGLVGAGRTVLRTIGRVAAAEGTVALATEIPIQAAVYAYKREIESPWSFRDSAINVLAAGVGGAVLGGTLAGGIEGTRAMLRSYRESVATGKVTPTPELEEAAGVLEDSLTVQEQNPLGASDFAEEVHQEALEVARAQVANGQPVDVQGVVAGMEPPDPLGNVIARARDSRQVIQVDPLTLEVDARTFQFKGGGDAEGVTGALAGVERFDPHLAGVAFVWERADGARFIADGHQRVGLARRAIAAGQDPAEVQLNAFLLREAEGVTAVDARRIAAVVNMAQGTGSALDAAKILRAVGPAGEAALPPLPPRSALVRQARGLAALGEEEFLQVVNGVIDERFGAIVGQATSEPKLQAAMIQVMRRAQPANEVQARSIADQVRTQGVETRTTEDLFGEQSFSESLYLERAQVLDQALRLMRQDRAVFGGLVANQERIAAGASNVLDRAGNLARSQEAADVATQISIRANSKGSLSDALAAAAGRVRDGTAPATAARDFLKAARREILQGDTGGKGTGGARRGGKAGSGPKVGRAQHLAGLSEEAKSQALREFKAGQAGRSIEQLYQVAEAHQTKLVAAAEQAAKELGEDVVVVNPGVKKRIGSEEKIARKGYPDASQLTDVVRIGFKVDTPARARTVVTALARSFEVLDEGLSPTPMGYIDYKALVRFADGTVGEIQLWDPAMLNAKKGRGHALYEQARALTPEQADTPEGQMLRAQLEQESKELYALALAEASVEWRRAAMQALPEDMRALVQSAVEAGATLRTSGMGGAQGKASSQAAREISLPESSTSSGTTRRQESSPSLQTKASSPPPGPSRMNAGRPSQLKNRSAIDAPPRAIIQKVDDPHSAQPAASRTGTVSDEDYEGVLSAYRALQDDLGAQLKVTQEIDGELVERQASAVIEQLDTLEESLERIRLCSVPARSTA